MLKWDHISGFQTVLHKALMASNPLYLVYPKAFQCHFFCMEGSTHLEMYKPLRKLNAKDTFRPQSLRILLRERHVYRPKECLLTTVYMLQSFWGGQWLCHPSGLETCQLLDLLVLYSKKSVCPQVSEYSGMGSGKDSCSCH